MEERFVKVKHQDYIKACEEFGFKRSEFSFFVFEILWDCNFATLGEKDVHLVYDNVKNGFFEEMTNSKIVDSNMKLFEKKKEYEKAQEEFCTEEVYNFDDEQDDYDLQFGPVRKRNR